jgi:Ca2+-binding RTX toxin-like protein
LRNSGASWNDSTTNPGNLSAFTFNWGPIGSALNYSKQTGGFYQLGAGSVAVYNPSYVVDYSVRNTTVVDANPRIISNIIANQNNRTLLSVQDDPNSTPGGRKNPLSGKTNPLAYNGYFTMVGQFFDHGLDFVRKGKDGVVITPILPGDPLYLDPAIYPNAKNYFTTSRTNTVAGESINAVSPHVDLSQAYGSVFSHTVLLKEWKIIPGNIIATGYLLAHENKVSSNGAVTSLDGGQPNWNDIKANAAKLGLTLRDYNVNDIPQLRQNVDGSLYQDPTTHQAFFVAKHNISGATVYIQDTSKSALAAANLTLVTTERAFLTDQAAYALAPAVASPSFPPGFPILTADGDNPVGYNAYMQAFFTSAGYGSFNGIGEHYISGDGRTNENIGLTAIHEVFHNEHERNVDIIKNIGQFADNGNGTWTAINDQGGTDIWTGEQLFQSAKILTEGTYQHLIFQEFARKYSPNIDNFDKFDITLNPNISSEFAMAVYRLGHSQLTETVQRGVKDPVTGKITLVNDTLFDDFLNPGAYKTGMNGTAAEIAIGMSLQTGNAIDEWTTNTLRNQLVKTKEDLATRNLVRGRDSGTPSLNDTRASLYAQTGMLELKPYASWNEFKNNLTRSEATKEFIMAYAHDAILTNTDSRYVTAIQNAIGSAIAIPTTLAQWGAFQLTYKDTPATTYVVGDIVQGVPITAASPLLGFDKTPTIDGLYTKALKAAATVALQDSAFMNGGNKDFWNIDLWIGGLAEGKVKGGMLGSTFDAIFATQMSHLQNGDRFYYLSRFKLAANFLEELDAQLFSDIVMRNTGAKHLYSDIFSVPDSVVEMSDYVKSAANTYASVSDLVNAVNAPGSQILAGWVGNTFYSNPGNYKDSRGLINQNGSGNSSEVVGGTDAAESINSAGGNDTAWGDGGDDTIDGGSGFNYLHGGEGHDIIRQSNNGKMWGDAGNDSIYGGNGDEDIFGGIGNDLLLGNGNDDEISGGQGNDVIYGDNPNDSSAGGNDDLDGDDGNDFIWGQLGNDTIKGGEGQDTAGFKGISSNYTIEGRDLANNIWAKDLNRDGFIAVEDLTGQDGRDLVKGIELLQFADQSVRIGGAPNISLSAIGTVGSANLAVSLTDPGVANSPSYSYQWYSSTDSGVTSTAITVATLATRNNVSNSLSRVVVNYSDLSGSGALTSSWVQVGDVGNNTLTGSIAANDILIGLDGNDNLIGGAGDDTMDGGAGNDILDSHGDSIGIDSLSGGTDDDTYGVYNSATTIVENAGEGNDTVWTAVNYTLSANIENMYLVGAITGIGNADNNSIFGYGADKHIINGADGNDSLYGGTGVDILNGGADNDYLNGGLGADSLNGGTGNDVLDGSGDSAGLDTFAGETGDDTYGVYNSDTIIIEDAGAGNDSVWTAVSYTLAANVEALYLTGDTNGTGNAGANIIYGYGVGNNIIDGGDGIDNLFGGAGNDTFILSKTSADNIGDFGIGTDQLQISASAFGGGLVAGLALTSDQIRVGATNTADTVDQRFIFDTTNGDLFFDVDGNAASIAIKIGNLSGTPSLNTGSFVIV